MKIVIITSSYPNQSGPGAGGAPFLPAFIQALKRSGHEVFVVAPEYEGGAISDEPAPVHRFRIALAGRRLADTASFSPRHFIFYFRFFISGGLAFLKALRERRPDHVLACWAVPSGILALSGRFLTGTRFSVWSLGSDVWKLQKHGPGRALLRFIFRRAAHIFADGFGLASIVSRISGRPCEFLATTRPLDFGKAYALKIDKRQTRFLFVGRLDYDKGPDLLLEAFTRAYAANPALHLTILGSGTLEESLKRAQAALPQGAVHFFGAAQEADIVSYLAATDGVVIPSRFDSIPLVLSEALQAGKPVIATDTGDTGALIRKYGIGLVVRPNAPGDLAEKLLQFASMVRAPLLKGIPEAAALFSVGRSCERFLERIKA